ncbi:MAG: hypothetical protein HYU80_00940 [Candidatus Blackburnbacteria bacterium]|nr:hypothetical protein [Candidatus Blackburnbacteria bacterium]
MDSANPQEWKISILCVTVLLALVFTIDSTQKITSSNTTPPLKQEQEAIVNSSRIYLLPKELVVKANKETTVTITIDAPEEKITGAELKIKFDPTVVKIVDILYGDFLEKPTIFLNQVDNKEGKAIFTIGTLTPKPGKGNLAHLKILGVKEGATNISLANETKVVALGKTGNIAQTEASSIVRVQ